VRARPELQPLLYAVGGVHTARAAYIDNTARNLRVLARAREIVGAAAARGIELLPWKGAALAEPLWGDAGLRPMSDLDFLIRPNDLAAVEPLMRELGFRRSYADRARFSPTHGHDLSFTEDDPFLVVELHYRLHHDLGGDASVDAIFARARDGRPVASDSLFGAGHHAATHAFGEHLFWPIEIALLARAAGGTDEAIAEATRRRLHVAFSTALALASELLPSLLPRWKIAPLRRLALTGVLGRAWWAQPPSRARVLAAKALLTDEPRDALSEIARKLWLRGVELRERMRAPAARS
jgi:hypothetical protein